MVGLLALVSMTSSLAQVRHDQYLAFQIFTASRESATSVSSFPPQAGSISEQVGQIVRATGTVGKGNRKLAFVVGPLAFDDSDDYVRKLIREAFSVAMKTKVAVGFHIDDSMFWDRVPSLNQPENVEWLDWSQTPTTGRRLDWSPTPKKIMPQLCLNSPAVIDLVRRRATVIGEEVVRGVKILRERHRPDLFLGVIAGWETQLGRDYATNKPSGFHALANEGFSKERPPADIYQARVEIVTKFIDFWAASLAAAGVPDDKIYSHIAFMPKAAFDFAWLAQTDRIPPSYLETSNFTPPASAFGAQHRAGFSTYPQLGLLEQIDSEVDHRSWASCEGSALEPSQGFGDGTEKMEHYLGNLFNRGADFVNVFGWGVGDHMNPFRKAVEAPAAVGAYQRFLKGGTLPSDPPSQLPSSEFFKKIRRTQKALPPFMATHADEKVAALYKKLGYALQSMRYVDAEKIMDELLKAIE